MQTVYELSPSDLEEAVREWLERKRPGQKVYNVHFFQRPLVLAEGGTGRPHTFANVEFAQHLEKARAKSTARSAASAVLGGSGGAVDRSSGLSEGFDEDDV